MTLIDGCLFRTVVFPAVFDVTLAKLNGLAGSTSSLLVVAPVNKYNFLLVKVVTSAARIALPFIMPFVNFLVILTCTIQRCGLRDMVDGWEILNNWGKKVGFFGSLMAQGDGCVFYHLGEGDWVYAQL